MAKWFVRCTRCDGRRVLPRHPHEYKRPPKCRRCGHNRFYTVRRPLQKTCHCPGYWFPHRAGSRCCDCNHRAFYHQAVRQGITDPDLLFDLLLDGPGKKAGPHTPIPF